MFQRTFVEYDFLGPELVLRMRKVGHGRPVGHCEARNRWHRALFKVDLRAADALRQSSSTHPHPPSPPIS